MCADQAAASDWTVDALRKLERAKINRMAARTAFEDTVDQLLDGTDDSASRYRLSRLVYPTETELLSDFRSELKKRCATIMADSNVLLIEPGTENVFTWLATITDGKRADYHVSVTVRFTSSVAVCAEPAVVGMEDGDGVESDSKPSAYDCKTVYRTIQLDIHRAVSTPHDTVRRDLVTAIENLQVPTAAGPWRAQPALISTIEITLLGEVQSIMEEGGIAYWDTQSGQAAIWTTRVSGYEETEDTHSAAVDIRAALVTSIRHTDLMPSMASVATPLLGRGWV
jgi:hypothetical protein